jgi:hypothetical protein
MIYTLVILICLADVQLSCELREETVEGLPVHPGAAFMEAQPIVAHWIETHPGYVVRQWRLLPGRGA